jgi:hypothetical protein
MDFNSYYSTSILLDLNCIAETGATKISNEFLISSNKCNTRMIFVFQPKLSDNFIKSKEEGLNFESSDSYVEYRLGMTKFCLQNCKISVNIIGKN